MRETSESKHSKLQRDTGKSKNGNSLGPKNAAGTRAKKNKDGDESQSTSVSRVSVGSDSRPKQPFALRTKNTALNDRQISDSNSKPTPIQIKARVSKVLLDCCKCTRSFGFEP